MRVGNMDPSGLNSDKQKHPLCVELLTEPILRNSFTLFPDVETPSQ